ncbi:hypothetical protein [Kibdelosporangium aridum]|uniref:hypothetical protein n=1 Tax=Kibdelosporangium aridum TaxID=2030 RepID=UPI00190E6545|nr:hypothetical protein [Kibdelosporangium aridum]
MPLDLRTLSNDEIITRVQTALALKFDLATQVSKRRSLGFRTTNDTWVRIEVRALDRIDGQGWNGVECAEVLESVSKPAWHQGIAWIDRNAGLAWRADETELVLDPPIKPGGILATHPKLSAEWWRIFNASLDALVAHHTTRRATPGMRPLTQDRVTAAIHQVFPDVETTVDEWATAHGDFAWANLTAPNCVILDWEDWGRAPRGYDAATLWSESFAVPGLAERIYMERRDDLDSHTGRLMRLYRCAVLIAAGDRSGALLEPAKAHAAQLVSELGP